MRALGKRQAATASTRVERESPVAGNLHSPPEHRHTHTPSPTQRRETAVIALIGSLALSRPAPSTIQTASIAHIKPPSTQPDPHHPHPSTVGDSIRSCRPSIRTVDTAEFSCQNLAARHERRLPFPGIRTTSSCPRSNTRSALCPNFKSTASTAASTPRLYPVRDFAIAQLAAGREGAGPAYGKEWEYAVLS